MNNSQAEKEQEKAEELGLTDKSDRRVGLPDTRLKCACGKPVEKESPQLDQCLACFNRP